MCVLQLVDSARSQDKSEQIVVCGVLQLVGSARPQDKSEQIVVCDVSQLVRSARPQGTSESAQLHRATVKNRESFQVVKHESLLWPAEACLSQYANSCM